MQVSQALNPRRIARTLITVFVLSLIQTVVPPVVSPIVSAPKAEAVTGTVTSSVGGSGSTIQIPTGVFSVTFTVVGGAGGKGGDDSNIGKNGTVAGRTVFTVAVTPGDVIGLYPGNAGTAAGACAGSAPGGAGGTDNFPDGAYSINGTYFQSIDFSGGRGGNAGPAGCSGAGGGAGAASVATVNSEIVAIAGGAGGGGGTGSGNNYAADWGGTLIPNGTFFKGETGTSTVVCTGSNQNGDGGGGGGGGGGYYGGKGGLAPLITAECAGISGSPGGNYVVSRATNVTNDLIAQTSNGYVTYEYNAQATTSCSKSTAIIDIYTVESITYTGNCTWTVPSTVNVIDFFAVGGGGGGGGDGGSGGGGGAALLRTAVAVTPNSNVTLKVGGGGAGGSWAYAWGPIAGEATTITLASGTVFSANGGSAGTGGPNSGAGAGGVAVNGGFAGGAGGSSPTCFNVGGAGKTGTSTYFLGTINTFGGGGGGGACPNGATTTPASGANGGGSGGYAVSGSLNAPGGNATFGSGSGGGGGVATGSGLKVNGGKGGSGIILIRYATNSVNEFPVSLTSSLTARWIPDGLQVVDSARKGWIDASGSNATVASGNISGAPTIGTRGTTDGGSSTASSKSLLAVSGTTTDNITLVDLPSNYTMFHIVRYRTSGSKGRIVTTNTGNWLSGHYNGNAGLTHHNYWLTPEATNISSATNWVLSTDLLKIYRADGLDVSHSNTTNQNAQSTSTGFGVNNSNYAQKSDFDMADILIFNRQLTNGEIRSMEQYLARIYGLTIKSTTLPTETDTAVNMAGGQYYYTHIGYGGVINDTFTVEAWIKPGTQCGSGGGSRCAVFARENGLMFGVYNGYFYYLLYGTNSTWDWIDTTYMVPINEWHHVSIVKRGIANTNGGVELYLDGQLIYTKAGSPYVPATTAVTFASGDIVRQTEDAFTYIGTRLDNLDRFYGSIDEVKVWKVARTISQIKNDMHSNDASNPTLQYYWDFNKRVGSVQEPVVNLSYYGVNRGDLVSATTMPYVEIANREVTSAYTTITFPRTYITQFGGWKVPDSVTAATTIVVGGGGGAGKSDSNQAAPGGAGGGGGVTYSPTQRYTPGGVVQVKVGVGGIAGRSLTNDASLRSGDSSYVGIDAGLTALGGGGGGSNGYDGAGGSTLATGGGGGGSTAASSSCSMLGYNGGTVPSGYNGAQGGWGWGGLGGSSRGASITSGCYGTPGDAFVDPITNVKYGLTGSNQFHANWSTDPNYTKANNGWGGSVSYGGTAVASGIGMNGSTGVVVIRYITSFKPSFTKPTNAYLNVGMTETFTTNVAQDSATVGLTRTFRWESTTAGANGTFTPVKVGTGATNAAFSWVPTDTSTSGSQYLYRVVVTDSDTVGLFTQDTSPAVFAVINKTLLMTGPTSIKKQINIARNETFTISHGTPSYRYTLTPTIPGVTLDTSTVGSTILRISDTASAGTYLETLTVTDSVSASVTIPITLTISAPPSLANAAEIIDNDLVFNIDMANSASFSRSTGTISDISGTKKPVSIVGGATFSESYTGILSLSNSQYITATGFGTLPSFTIEAYINLQSISSSQICIFASEQSVTNVPYFLCVDNTRTLFTGFYNGSWTYKRSTEALTLGKWTHIVGTFDPTLSSASTRTELYVDGVPTTLANSSEGATLVPPAADTNRVYINKYFWTSTAPTSAMDIGYVRLYRSGFNQSEVTQNYNATKARFATINANQLAPSQKYGKVTLESFTVTSGGETETVSFAVGNRDGITWDTTSTPGQVKLTVQETLTPGTYYDTITVTDNFAQSTFLPIKFTVSKADTITIYVDTPTALNYTGNQALFTPSVRTIGAVGLESGTAISTTVRFKPAGTTCATGGYCRIGDIGPGGGIVFIDTSTASSDGRIYEVAPQNWSGSDDLSTVATYCSNNNSNIGASQVGIGWGETNTNLAKTSCLGGAVAKVVSFNSSNGTGYSDWFIPSKNEAIELAKIPATAGLLNIGNNWNVGNWGYWASTEVSSSVMWAIGHVGATFAGNSNVAKSEATRNMVRPVRAFRSCWAIDTCTALLTTETPTAAGIYVISPTSGASAATLAERYSSVRYIDSRLTVNRIAQRAQVIPFINVNFPDTFTVNVIEGNGNGAVSYSATNGTSTGCAFDYKKLYASTQGTCTVTVVKAGDRNYLPDTATAGMLLLSFVNNQPSPSVGSGPNIALSGQTSVTLDPNVAPTISSLSTYTAQAGVTSLIITGAGFDSSNLAGITVKFWRNVLGTGFTVNAQNSQITVTVPVGATTGKVTVTTPNGQAVSEFVLTITP